MHYRKNRRFRRRPNGRGHHIRDNGGERKMLRFPSSVNDIPRSNIRSQQSAEKLVEKYSTLAKEAKSSGDKILSENYFQHADHFIRIVEEKNLNQNKISIQAKDATEVPNQNLNENNDINQGKDKDKDIEEKKE